MDGGLLEQLSHPATQSDPGQATNKAAETHPSSSCSGVKASGCIQLPHKVKPPLLFTSDQFLTTNTLRRLERVSELQLRAVTEVETTNFTDSKCFVEFRIFCYGAGSLFSDAM